MTGYHRIVLLVVSSIGHVFSIDLNTVQSWFEPIKIEGFIACIHRKFFS